jgi:PAS domain S-box-containing protein
LPTLLLGVNRTIHDIRNDLAVAIGTLHALIDGKLAADARNLEDVLDALVDVDAKLDELRAQSRAALPAQASEEWLHQLIENAPVPSLLARDGRIVFVNALLEGMLGYGRGELIGRPAEALVPPRFRDDEVGLRVFLTDPTPRPVGSDRELFARKKDGTEIPVEIGRSPVETGSGPAVRVVFLDLSERHRAEWRLHALIEAAPNPMVVMGPHGAIARVNRQAEQLFGYAREELLGQSVEVLIPERFRRGHVGLRETFLAAPAARPMGAGRDLYGRRKDGSEVPIEIGLNPIDTPDGRLVLASIIDITERKRTEELRIANAVMQEHAARLEALNRELEKASQFKTEFVATMSHELRTPLTAIIGMAELLDRSALDPAQRLNVATINESAEALMAIINSILDFSKIEAGKMELRNAPFLIENVIEGAAEVLAMQARSKGVALHTFVDPGIPAVKGDADRLRQVLLNLIGNAVKYTERGEIVVRATAEQTTRRFVIVRVEVKDTGVGIAADQLSKLFEPFVQAHGEMSRTLSGTGLGLSISKRLVELMQGEIGVESEVGTGSRFWFSARFTRAGVGFGERKAEERAAVVYTADQTFAHIVDTYLQSWGMVGRRVADLDAVAEQLRAGDDRPAIAIVDVDDEPTRVRLDELATSAPELRGRIITVGRGGSLRKPVRQSHLFDSIVHASETAGEGAARRPGRAAANGPSSPATAGTILVAEDNERLRRLLQLQFNDLGLDVCFVDDGKQAVAALEQRHFAMVFMDCQMPVLDGYDATRAIRERERRTGDHVPIVAMTANAFAEDRDACLAVGMDDYLAKPVRLEQLRAMVTRWVSPAAV